MFIAEGEREQVHNGVQTGFIGNQLYDLLEETASRWKEGTRLDVSLLRALIKLSADRPDTAEEGFTPLDMAQAVGEIIGRGWSSQDDKEKMSDDVRRQWNKLQETWDRKREGLEQIFEAAGASLFPSLDKIEGGGAGRPSRYRITWVPLASAMERRDDGTETLGVPAKYDAEGGKPGNLVSYICEDITDAGLLARIFAQGYRLAGWRRWLMITVVGLPLLISLLLLLMLLFAVVMWTTHGTTAVAQSFVSLLIFFGVAWSSVGPLLNTGVYRIVPAPWWMQCDDGSRLLELRSPPKYPGRSIKAVRYTAACPICRGTVSVASGGIEFPWRLVGRCENSRREHVYSFDHVTRSGKSLR
jgi:hypothetical protein